MDSSLLLIFFLSITSVHSALELTSIETYWRTVLPQTPIPSSIQELLHPEKKKNSFELERAPTMFISYKYAATDNQIKNDPNVPLFFLKENLNPGTKMALDLARINSPPPFLPDVAAKAAPPFSSDMLPEILRYFGVERGSAEEDAVRRTLEECEELPLNGDRKRCVRSVEDMVDFVGTELGGGDVRVVETTEAGGRLVAQRQEEFSVGPAEPRPVKSDAMVSCHPEPYPRALYYCHTTMNVEAYKVQLIGKEGLVVDTIAICHTDTSTWNPGYIGFRMLNVKPGTKPICHFMPQGHLIFALLSKKTSLTIRRIL